MDYAIRKRDSRSEELVYARDLANSHYVRHHKIGNLICPECGEPVLLAHGEERTYFRHLPNNPKTQNCPNYYSDSKYAALYQKQQKERKSSQRSKDIYILKRGATFGLFLGFPPLEERVVVAARNENLVVQIINPNNAELKENRLQMKQVTPGEITYIRLEWIYDYYSLKFSECSFRKDIIKIWREYQSGISEEGILFRYSENYARGIAENGEITINKYYYFATASEVPDYTKDFLECEYVGKLQGKSFGYRSKWRIYRVQFTKVTEEALIFADNLGAKLIEWHPPLLPLWPPHVQFGSRQIYSKPTNALSLAQKTDTSNYYQQTEEQSRRHIPKVQIKAGWLIHIPVRSSTHITSNCGYESHLICGYSDEVSQYLSPDITLEYGKISLKNGDFFHLKDKTNLSFKSDSRCNIYHYSEKQLKNVYWNELAILTLLNLSEGDRICVRHGMDPVYQVSIPKRVQTVVRDAIKSDEEMYQKLILLGGIFISTPVKVKYIQSHLGKYPNVYGYLSKALQSGKIPKRAYYYLISEFYREIEK